MLLTTLSQSNLQVWGNLFQQPNLLGIIITLNLSSYQTTNNNFSLSISHGGKNYNINFTYEPEKADSIFTDYNNDGYLDYIWQPRIPTHLQ